MQRRVLWRQLWTPVASLCVAVAACDPIGFAAIQVSPQLTKPSDSTALSALAVVGRIATRHGLVPSTSGRTNDQGWNACFARETLFLCGKLRAGEAQFQMRQWHSLSADAMSLKAELLDSLRAQFGDTHVRECKWTDKRDLPSSWCEPLTGSAPVTSEATLATWHLGASSGNLTDAEAVERSLLNCGGCAATSYLKRSQLS